MENIIDNQNIDNKNIISTVNNIKDKFRKTEFKTRFENGNLMSSMQILRNYTKLLNIDKVKKEYKRVKEFIHKRRLAKFKHVERKNLIKKYLRMQRLNKKVGKINFLETFDDNLNN